MSSKRKAIRNKVAALLSGATNAGTNVFASRVRPVWESELPAILVYAKEEAVTVFNESPREYERTLSLGIEIVAKADEELDDALDDIAQQVESKFSEYQTLDDTASEVVLAGTQIQIVGEGENQHGACALTYEVTYYTFDVASGAVEPNELGNFETAHVEYAVQGGVGTPPAAEDEITLPQA